MTTSIFERPLSTADMTRVMIQIMSGQMAVEEIAAFLTTLARRGETAEELAAAVSVLRAHAVPLPLSKPLELCDTCGTGGDGQGTINVSTLTALAIAAAGAPVAKHGNRSASSRCGSADVLEALGLQLDASPALVARSIEELGFGFCFAPRFHPAMKAVAPVRKALGIRTIFNLIGPLANPAPLTFQLVGVSEARFLRPVAEALARLGVRHGVVVHGRDGLDEITTTAPTDAMEVRAGAVEELVIEPQTMGVAPVQLEALRGGDVARNADIARTVLRGEPSAHRDLVALNTACALYAADRVPTIREGVARATEVLASRRAWTLLMQVTELSRHAG